jgi:hypothetical protein
VWTVIEVVGLALVVAFSWFIWPPLPLLVAGVLLVAVAVIGERGGFAKPPAEDPEEATT